MDEGGILVVNLDKGRLGESAAALLGSLILSHISLAGLARSVTLPQSRRDFAVLVDEFQTFTTPVLANMLSELRKYGVSMVLATQYLSAIDLPIRHAVFGNVGTVISFRVGADDAAYLCREMGEPFSMADFTNLPRYNAYLRLLITGEPSRPFSARVLAGIPEQSQTSVEREQGDGRGRAPRDAPRIGDTQGSD